MPFGLLFAAIFAAGADGPLPRMLEKLATNVSGVQGFIFRYELIYDGRGVADGAYYPKISTLELLTPSRPFPDDTATHH